MVLDCKRILYKVSGELLRHKESTLAPHCVQDLAQEIADILRLDKEVVLVCGGGNIVRGREACALNREDVDTAGMMATYVNAMMLRAYLQKEGFFACVFGIFEAPSVARYSPEACRASLQKEKIVFLVGGTGFPYFSTDTLAAVRASELHCDLLVKATSVDGVYDADPKKSNDAQKIDCLTYDEAIEKKLEIMDIAAYSVLKQSGVPTRIFDRSQAKLSDLLRGLTPSSRIIQEKK